MSNGGQLLFKEVDVHDGIGGHVGSFATGVDIDARGRVDIRQL